MRQDTQPSGHTDQTREQTAARLVHTSSSDANRSNRRSCQERHGIPKTACRTRDSQSGSDISKQQQQKEQTEGFTVSNVSPEICAHTLRTRALVCILIRPAR